MRHKMKRNQFKRSERRKDKCPAVTQKSFDFFFLLIFSLLQYQLLSHLIRWIGNNSCSHTYFLSLMWECGLENDYSVVPFVYTLQCHPHTNSEKQKTHNTDDIAPIQTQQRTQWCAFQQELNGHFSRREREIISVTSCRLQQTDCYKNKRTLYSIWV